MIIERLVSDVAYRIRAIFRRDDVEKELNDELALHIEMETDKLVRFGMPRADADRQAKLAFGGVERIKDDTRDVRGVRWLDVARQDVRYAMRQLARTPLFTITAAFSLGVGIAVAVAAFSLINAIIFKPLPIPDAASLVSVSATRDAGEPGRGVGFEDIADLRASGAFKSLAASHDYGAKVTVQHAAPENAAVTIVTPNMFDVLGLRLAEGRTFSADARQPEVIISDRFRAHIARPGQRVLGSTIQINKTTFSIIGVTPRNFAGITPLSKTALWLSQPSESLVWSMFGAFAKERDFAIWSLYGRLADGVTKEAAEVRLNMVAADLATRFPKVWHEYGGKTRTVSVRTLGVQMLATNPTIPLLIASEVGLVAIVLILGCTNVAGLLLTRAVTRRHEVAVRLTLGASRRRLITQLVIESILLSLTGCAVGLISAEWGLRLAGRIPYFAAFDLTPDWRVLSATAVVCLLCAIMFGVTPTIHALRVDLKAGLSGQGVIGDRGGVRARLMALQVCLAFLLIMLGFTASRGIRSQLQTAPGFNVNGLPVIDPGWLMMADGPPQQWENYLAKSASELRTIDGVSHVIKTRRTPMDGSDWRIAVATPNGSTAVGYEAVDTAYFATIGMRVLRGRLPRASDLTDERRPAIVNRAMTKALGHDVLGGTLRVANQREVVVVGVVDDIKQHEVEVTPEPYLYEVREEPRKPDGHDYILARVADGTEAAVTSEFLSRIRTNFPDRVPPAVTTLRSRLELRLQPQKYIANIALAVGIIELALAAIGLYSLLLYSTLTRTREIGVRIALGARPARASFTVMREGLVFVAGGIVLGMALSIPAAMFAARGALMGANASDPFPFIAAAAGIIFAAAAATLVPARKAARVEPMVALRYE